MEHWFARRYQWGIRWGALSPALPGQFKFVASRACAVNYQQGGRLLARRALAVNHREQKQRRFALRRACARPAVLCWLH